jgi:hemerythrin-like domain-containing protein
MSESTKPICGAGRRVIDRIKAEHALLARIIAAMQAWVVQSREPGAKPDYDLFAAMLRYVQEVPDRVHHPQEDAVLFPAIADAPGARAVIVELEREHALGEDMLKQLRESYESLKSGAPNALNRLSTAMDDFSEFYWAHMRKEEESLLPLAAASLAPAQWEDIEREFVVVNDPLFGSELVETYRRLYEYIAERMRDPIKGYVKAAAPRGNR